MKRDWDTIGTQALPPDDLFADATEREAMSVPTRELEGLVRRGAPIESQAFAVRTYKASAKLKAGILDILEQHGPMTALELEALPQYEHYAISTVRACCTILRKHEGRIECVGRRNGAALLAPVP